MFVEVLPFWVEGDKDSRSFLSMPASPIHQCRLAPPRFAGLVTPLFHATQQAGVRRLSSTRATPRILPESSPRTVYQSRIPAWKKRTNAEGIGYWSRDPIDIGP